MTREVQYPRCGRKGALQIHPGRRAQRRRRRAARTVASHRQPADPASRRDLVRTRRDHAAALRPRRRGRDVPPQRRVLAHRNRRALSARYGRSKHPAARRTASTGRLAARFRPRCSNNRSTPASPGTVPRGVSRHVPRPPPAHRLRHRHRAAAPRSHRRRRRVRPMARALRRAPAHQGRPHGRSDDAAGRALGQLRAASDLERHPGHTPARDRTRDRRARSRTRRRVADGRAAHRLHGEALQHRHAQPEAVDG